MVDSRVVQLNNLLEEIQSACIDFNLHLLDKTILSVKNFANQNQYLDIAVMGQFKVGKSSFLNSLIKKHLLPVGNIPVTSVITRIKYGPLEKATITFGDGRVEEVSINSIYLYVSETENPENHKNVKFVDIEVPELDNKRTIRLVDTPGLGSVWRHNTETTNDWFPETGGVLFLISAEKPISEAELNFLQQVSQYSPEITIVITKTDLFSEEQIKEIESFTSDMLKRKFERDFPIIRYSTLARTNEFIEVIEHEFFQPLILNQKEIFVKILQHKIYSLAGTCLAYLDISYKASMKAESERNQLKKAILDEHLNSHFVRRELLLIVSSYKNRTRKIIQDYLESFKKNIEEKIMSDYVIAFPGWKGNLYKLTRQYEHWLKLIMKSELEKILLNEDKTFDILNNVKEHLSYYLKSFRERLNENLARVLGVQMQPQQWEIEVRPLNRPDISVGRSFESHLDMLWFLFPMVIFRNLFRSYFLRRIPYEVEKNIYRLTSDLTEKVNKEIDKLMAQALAYINEELKTIESLLSEQKGDSRLILDRIDSIKKQIY